MKKILPLILLIITFSACSQNNSMKLMTDKIMEQEIIQSEELEGISNEELRILRNTVFAQYGYPFESDDLKGYFYNDNPYGYSFTRNESYSNDSLSDADKKNINVILLYENNEKEKSQDESKQEVLNEALNQLTSAQIYNLIYDDDIFSFYPELKAKFNTDLKRKYFEESDEYAEYMPKFQSLKEQVKQHYFVKDVSHTVALKPYDLESGGFYFIKGKDDWVLGQEIAYQMTKTQVPTEIEGFYSNDDFILDLSSDYLNSYTQLFIPCSERVGLEIENNIDNVRFIHSFEIEVVNPDLEKYRYFIRIKKLVRVKNVKYQIILDDEVLAEKHIE